MTVGVPPSGVVAVRTDSIPSNARMSSAIDLLLGEEGVDHIGVLSVYGGQNSEDSVSAKVRHIRHQPLRESTWVSGIGSLKVDREVQANRKPSGCG
jgi:hypothetical protein